MKRTWILLMALLLWAATAQLAAAAVHSSDRGNRNDGNVFEGRNTEAGLFLRGGDAGLAGSEATILARRGGHRGGHHGFRGHRGFKGHHFGGHRHFGRHHHFKSHSSFGIGFFTPFYGGHYYRPYYRSYCTLYSPYYGYYRAPYQYCY